MLMVNSLILHSYRFKIILQKCSGSKISFWGWFKTIVLARFLSTFIPQTGNVYRGIYLKKTHQISYTQYAGSLFSFAWIDTCLNIIYAVIIVLTVKAELRIGNFRALHLLVFLAAAIAVIPIVLEFIFRLVKFRSRSISWLHTKLSEMLTVSVTSVRDRAYMLKVVLTGMVAFVNSLLIFYICFLSLGVPVNPSALALFYVVLRLSMTVVITPGNLGVQELAYGVLGEQMQLGMAQGIVISVMVRILNTTFIIVLGTIFGGIELLRHRKDYSELQE